MPIRLKTRRVYEPAEPGDGKRYLVERLWPRGIKKDALRLDGWLKEVSPSPALRKWYAHDVAKWDEFVARYQTELEANEEAWRPLLETALSGPVTLVYAARDEEHNSAVVLARFLTARARAGRSRR